MKVIAVVVTYNRKVKLVACLKAIAAQTVPCDVLVVDNASIDGTEQAVAALGLTHVVYVNTGANLGGAGGFSFGIRHAVETGADAIWIMDDDVLPQPQALAALLTSDSALGSEYGWLSSKCLDAAGNICPMNRQRTTPYRKVGKMDQVGERVPAQMASFVSLFFPVAIVRRFGLPISEFFIWCDDLEWTRRVSRERSCFVVPTSVVVHDIAGTVASDIATDTLERVPRYFFAFRNEFFTYRREGVRGMAYYFAKCAKYLFRILLFGRGMRKVRLAALVRGLLAGARFAPCVDMI